MVCYRRFGHNEGDEPSYTQPQMYERIEARRSVRKLYTEALVNRGDLTLEEAEKALEDFSARLQAALDETRQSAPPRPTALVTAPPVEVPPSPETGVRRQTLDKVAAAVHSAPDGIRSWPASSRRGLASTARVRSTGPWPRRWPSALC
jgi:2-oxoglutarate dehydrogenase complex dehydrogenase (E1) component-like enzyme